MFKSAEPEIKRLTKRPEKTIAMAIAGLDGFVSALVLCLCGDGAVRRAATQIVRKHPTY
jgi:hypothetical protein